MRRDLGKPRDGSGSKRTNFTSDAALAGARASIGGWAVVGGARGEKEGQRDRQTLSGRERNEGHRKNRTLFERPRVHVSRTQRPPPLTEMNSADRGTEQLLLECAFPAISKENSESYGVSFTTSSLRDTKYSSYLV